MSELIYKLWDMQWDAWQHRNVALHNTPIAEIMEGKLSLDRSLRKEWRQGFLNFPNVVKAILPEMISSVIAGTVEEKKGLFVLIRTTRVNLGDDRIVDEFSDPKSSLRKWVGL